MNTSEQHDKLVRKSLGRIFWSAPLCVFFIYSGVKTIQWDGGTLDRSFLAFGVGTGYGMYDMRRVADNTAHQALRVIQMNTGMGIPQEKQDKFQTTLNGLFEHPDKLVALLKKVGKPDYHPTYMIQHGMGSFTGNKTKDGLVPDFDPDKAWKEILDGLTK